MSELSDREDRFVEDQRRVAGLMTPDLKAVATMMREIDSKDALLAEAAEVLRDFPAHAVGYSSPDLTVWWQDKLEPLLDKFGG